MATAIARHPARGLKVVGILCCEEQDAVAALSPPPYLGGLELAPVPAQKYGIRCAVVASPRMPRQQLSETVEHYASHFHHVLIIPGLLGLSSLGGKVKGR